MPAEILYLVLTLMIYLGIFSAALFGREALLVLVGIYTVLANITVGKLVTIHGLPFMSNACLSGSLFWIGILLTRYFDAIYAKRAIIYSYGALVSLVVVGTLVKYLPGGENADMNQSLATLFSFMPLVLIGAIFSFGSSFTFTLAAESILKKHNPESNKTFVQFFIVAIANLIDITVFCLIVFFNAKEPKITLILTSWTARIIVVLCGLPFIWVLKQLYASPRFPIIKDVKTH